MYRIQMTKPLPDKFVNMIKDDIEKDVLPDLETVLLNHYPHLQVAYKPKDPESFLFAYVIGNLEASYHKLFIMEFGLENYSDAEYFAIHRMITEYKQQIIVKVKEYLQKQNK